MEKFSNHGPDDRQTGEADGRRRGGWAELPEEREVGPAQSPEAPKRPQHRNGRDKKSWER